MVVKNTEELGMLTEKVICDVSKIKFNTNRKYNGMTDEMYQDIYKSIKGMYKTIKLTDHVGNMNKEYDFMGVNDTKKKVIKVSIKTIMKATNKICPQKVGQCSLKKFNERFNENFRSTDEIKMYYYNSLEKSLNEYLKNTFCCDNTLIYKFREGIMYDIEKIRVPKFINVVFSLKNDIDVWNESNTVYVVMYGERYTLGEIQIHRNRDCIKYRFNSDTLIKLIEYGYIENLKIREYKLEYKYDISVDKNMEVANSSESKDKNASKKKTLGVRGGVGLYKSFNYIGSKKKLLAFLDEKMGVYMGKSIKEIESFSDLFCGTGIVSYYMIQNGVKRVVTNDIQHYAYVVSSIWSKSGIDVEKIKGIINVLNDVLRGIDIEKDVKDTDFIYHNYTEGGIMRRMYLTKLNGLRVDRIRQRINEMYDRGDINQREYYLLIKVLLYGVTAVSNTASVYGAYLKKYKACALKDLVMDGTLVDDLYDGDLVHTSYNMDISKLIEGNVDTEVCYIDSPYNTRRYDDNYHLLETISRYDYPKIKGKTGLRDIKDTKSKFCSKVTVNGAFDDIFSKIKSRYIFVSYSSEGIVSKEKMMEIMGRYWKDVVCYEKDYQRFKSNKLEQGALGVKEYLFAGKK
jgi:adenine-specific DNA-methyltransferase